MSDNSDIESQATKFFSKKFLKDLKPDDSRVQLTGYARKVNPSNEFLLDDTTATIPVREIPEDLDKIKENMLYRVCGEIAFDGTGLQYIAAKAVLELTGLNLELYKQVEELRKKIP